MEAARRGEGMEAAAAAVKEGKREERPRNREQRAAGALRNAFRGWFAKQFGNLHKGPKHKISKRDHCVIEDMLNRGLII
jgi:hypothetical protein